MGDVPRSASTVVLGSGTRTSARPAFFTTLRLAVVGETSTVSAAMATLIPLRTLLEALVLILPRQCQQHRSGPISISARKRGKPS
jgi:hypothetical protein